MFTESSLGILVGYAPIPINKEILHKLEDYNFDIEHSQKCIEANKHNHITTTYYLLMKKFQAPAGVVEEITENSLPPHPPLLPFAPIFEKKIQLNARHRKYVEKKVEKKVESTGGSGFHEVVALKKSASPIRGASPVSNFHIKANSPNVKQARGRRYVSVGRCISKEPRQPSSFLSRPTRINVTKIRSSKTTRSRKVNQSADYKLSEFKRSFRNSPKFRDLSLIYQRPLQLYLAIN